MPTESSYPAFTVPELGLWDFLFERKDREFPDDKGEDSPLIAEAPPLHMILT
jgi:hypothetical protein